jgi:N-acetylmuramic acid 6-phosphate etherase
MGASIRHALVLPEGAPPEVEAVLASVRAVAPEGVVVRLPAMSLAADLRYTQPQPQSQAIRSAAQPLPAPPSFLGELALKLVLNATTTGAHIRSGTIYRNRMVAVMLTNAKLFHRAVGIVTDVTGAAREVGMHNLANN